MIRRVLALVLAGGLLCGCSQKPAQSSGKKLVVLGFDGCDPMIVQELMAQNRLPNFQRLAKQGSWGPLATSFPAQSPVAWSTFITGMDAGGHGIFDFLQRDPKTMKVVPSLSEVVDGQPHLLRQGEAFWKPLVDRDIPCILLKVPANFPPPQDGSRMLTGMGTPDLLGSYGTYTLYREIQPNPSANQSDPVDWNGQSGGQLVQVENRAGIVEASIIGPSNSSLPFKVGLDEVSQAAVLEFSNRSEQPVVLKVGQWSAWQSLDFGQNRAGMVRLLLRSLKPFQLYVSPVNIDPAQPATPISSPKAFSQELCRGCGPFYTQGMAEDTKALSNGALSDLEYLQQSRLVNQESWRLLRYGLKEFKSGLLFCYVSTIDLQSHVYWRQRGQSKSPYRDVVDDAYLEADKMVGETLDHLDGQGDLLVLSDHGFAPFNRSFDLNAWLFEKGYLKADVGAPLEKTDWTQTKAYGVGFNGLYLNLSGRESKGMLAKSESDAQLKQLSQELLAVRDPESGAEVISNVYLGEQIYRGPSRERGPDLLIGYARGYRVSWNSALGQRGKQQFNNNQSHWTGDHLIDPIAVPGVVFSSRKLSQPAGLVDIAPTILDYFGLAPGQSMSGKSLWGK